MKRAFLFLLFLVPTVVFGQIGSVQVFDGSNFEFDIDTQSSTTLYTANFNAPPSIWDGYSSNNKFYICELKELGNPVTLMGITYPAIISDEIPEVPYVVSITDTDLFENTDGNYDQFVPGETYSLQVTAYVANPLPEVVAQGQSDGVLIEGGEVPPDDGDGAAGAGSISLSVSPSSLTFNAGESLRNIEIDISAAGSGTIDVSSIREDRIYTLWGQDRGFTESVNLAVPAGFTETLNRQVELSTLDRAKALGSGTEGSFILRYVVEGRDDWGNPVSATMNVPAAVSGAPATTLDVRGLALELAQSPYFRGESVINSRITIEAEGSGTVVGQVYVDDTLDWTNQPAFAVSLSGTTTFEIEAELPTDTPGLHSVRVELINPEGYSAEETYEVSAEEPPFPPHTLTLIPEVAELSGFAGMAEAQNINGGVQYTFNGSATLKVLSMDNLELGQSDVDGLVVQYMNNAPNVPVIAGGFVEKEGAGQTIAEAAGGYVQVGRVAWQWAADGSSLTARSTLFIPRLGTEVAVLPDMPITSDGLTLVSYSWNRDDGNGFDAFGVNFRLHDVNQNRALSVIEDEVADRYGFSLSGSIAWNEKEGNATEEKELVSFSGLTFYTDGEFEGGITVSEDFDLIPDILTITEAGVELEDEELAFKLRGQLKNMPAPFEDLTTTFSLVFDTEGNVKGGLVPIDELSGGGQGISADDSTEWDFGFATVDVTYLGLDLIINQGTLNRDHSKVLLGADLYLNQLSGEGNRIGFGTIAANADGGLTLEDGLEITFDGDVVWPSMEGAINLISNRSLDLGSVIVSLDNLALQYGDGTFAFLFSGSFRLKVEAVEGGISFVNLRIGLDGSMGAPDIQGTDLSIMDFVKVRVNQVRWGSGTISYSEDQTTGAGTNRQPAIGDEPAVIEVDNYFEILGASINIGSGDSSIMSGGFEQFLFYSIGGESSFVLREAKVEVSGCELFADIKYDRTYLRVAGGITMQNISGAAVGKIGVIPATTLDGTPEPRAGEPTFGLFVMVEGLGIMVAPSVFLDSVGGGVFINPTIEDIETVLVVTGFDRPELEADIDEMRPAGGGDPGGFAVMLMAGVYVAERTLVEGEALITLTANYFSLDAKVTALEGMLSGRSYFLISWNPLYAEGNNVLEANLFDIFTIYGDLAFYAYGSDAWGIMGGVNVALMGSDIASGSFFIGPPGFMVETTVKMSLDIGFVSGYVQFSGMVWLYVVPTPDTWGAWAEVEVGGSLLWGLVSAKAAVEGALIGQGFHAFVYAVGRVHFKACWITVYKGSLWVSIKGGHVDGGKGRNDKYDQMIEDARNMAEQMESAKSDLVDALAAAEMSLYQLDEAQRQAAGLALVDRSGWVGRVLAFSFGAAEVESWPDGLPNELQEIQEMLFGEEGQAFVDLRTELEQIRENLNDTIDDLQVLQDQVLTRLEEYEQIILEDLPNIRDLSTTGNPIQGMESATVPVGAGTRTVQVGFNIDENKFFQQKQEIEGIRDGFAEYQDAFIQRAGLLDAKLLRLDEILFESEQSFTALMNRYNGIHTNMVDYIERFIQFQFENAQLAEENLQEIQYSEVPAEIGIGGVGGLSSVPTDQVIEAVMAEVADDLSQAELMEWTDRRVALINLLIEAQDGDASFSVEGLDPVQAFIYSGLELWWHLPNEGWELTIEMSEERITTAIESFYQNSTIFQQSWENATAISDTVFDRKADLYALLYELYDMLAVYGTGVVPVDEDGNLVEDAGGSEGGLKLRDEENLAVISQKSPAVIDRSVQVYGGGVEPAGSPGSRVPVQEYFSVKREEIGAYLELPVIDVMTGELVSRDQYSAFFRAEYAAEHPAGVVEYAVKVHPFGYDKSYRSTGTQMSTAEAIFQVYRVQRNYLFDLRVRGAGGLTTRRQGDIEMYFFDPEEDAEPFITSLDISDDSIPSWPVVILAELITSDAEELYAEWSAIDPESGVQRYEYSVGTYSVPEGAAAAAADAENGQDGGDAVGIAGGGFYFPGFGSVLEPAGQPGVIGGDEDAADVVPTDVLPWTDAGGRTAVVIKNLDLQHGHEYIVNARVTNGVGLQNVNSSEPVLVDLTWPQGQQVTQLIQQTVDQYPNSIRFEFNFAEEPESELVAHYVAVGSSPAADDLFPWTEMNLDFGRIANLPLAEGEPFYLSVRAANSVGLESTVSAELEFSFIDNSEPPAPMVVTQPSQNSTDGSQIAIGWNGVADEESGVISYAYALSSSVPTADELAGEEYQPDILDWVEVELSEAPYYLGKGTGGSFGDLPPLDGGDAGDDEGAGEAAVTGGGMVQMGTGALIQTGEPLQFDGGLDTEYAVVRTDLNMQGRVYALVRVTNGAGLSSFATSVPVIFDSSPPEFDRVVADAEQYRTDQLSCRLEASDPESGIQSYRYTVYRVLGGPVQQWVASDWIQVESTPDELLSLPLRISGFPAPGLQYGQEYRLDFEVKNNTGLVYGSAPVIIELVQPKDDDLLPLDGRQAPGQRNPAVRRVQ